MADKKRTGKHNQRRTQEAVVADIVEADILVAGSTYATLPPGSLILSAGIVVTTASGTLNATVDIVAAGTVLCNEVDVDDTGWKDGTVIEDAAYLAAGGDIVVKAGAVTPANGALVGKLVVAYIELPRSNGNYTD